MLAQKAMENGYVATAVHRASDVYQSASAIYQQTKQIIDDHRRMMQHKQAPTQSSNQDAKHSHSVGCCDEEGGALVEVVAVEDKANTF